MIRWLLIALLAVVPTMATPSGCKERKQPESRPIDKNNPNERPAVLHVITTGSRGLPYHVDAFLYDKNGRSTQVLDHTERSNDSSHRVLVVTTDQKLTVWVTGDSEDVIVTCEILGPAKEDWGIEAAGTRQAMCEAFIATRLGPR